MPRRSTASPADPGGATRGRWLALTVMFASLLVFAGLSVASWVIYDQAEQDLLEERTDEASAVLAVSVSNIRAPLDAAAILARVTGGDPDYFAMSLDDHVGGEGVFTSAALYEIGSNTELASIGPPIQLDEQGAVSVETLVRTAASEPFVVVDLLDRGRRLGYAVVDDPEQPTYVVYGERQLSVDPNVRRRTDEPFADLDYAIYLGDERPESLLGASVRTLPIDGRRASARSEFGNQQLLLVMTPIGAMTSGLFANMWWIVAVAGLLLSLAAAWLINRLYRRREEALGLAADNARLYDEQRQIAETLQLSLLPQHLEPPPGGDVAARYWPAGEASLIGGDFYDAFRIDDRRWGVVIGDVCGKGIDAAAITGLVRHTLRAAARTETSPVAVLGEVHQALLDYQPSTFCTVCFLYISVDDGRQTLTVSLGGHPPPLLRRASGEVVEIGRSGSLLGIFDPVLFETTVELEPGDTLVLYTDGLTDAPHDQAVPIEELIDLVAAEGDEPVALLADSIRPLKQRRRPLGSSDDTALVVVRIGTPSLVDDLARQAEAAVPAESAGV